MFLKRILPVTIMLIAIIISFWQFQNPCIENIDLTRQDGWQGSFEVKVERKLESCSFGAAFAGANYIFSVRLNSLQNWQEIMMVHHDDPIDFPRKNIQIIDEKTAVVFMNGKLTVITDTGRNWNIWDVTELPNWNFSDFGYIQDVMLTPEGNGILKLKPLSNKNTSIPQVETDDFGKNWKKIN